MGKNSSALGFGGINPSFDHRRITIKPGKLDRARYDRFHFAPPALTHQPLIEKQPHGRSAAIIATLATGFLLSLRSLAPAFNVPFISAALGTTEKLDYLANMPTVLMSALFTTLLGLQYLSKNFSARHIVYGAALLTIGISILMPIILSQQRASLFAFVATISIWLLVSLRKKPLKILLLLGLIGLLSFYNWPLIEQAIKPLIHKNQLVGFNRRGEELGAIWHTIRTNPITLFFGRGWGASFASPAVADIQVNYTHSLLSSLLLKTGLTGLVLGVFYIAALLKPLPEILRENTIRTKILVLSILPPLFIDIFLYASYKSLDFALMLVLLASLHNVDDRSEKALLYSNASKI